MTSITKKQFNQYHKGGKLRLICSVWDSLDNVKDKSNLWTPVELQKAHLNATKTSRVDTKDDGEQTVTKAYEWTLLNSKLVVLHTMYDNSKCDTCSMNDIQHNTILYALD